MPNWKAGDASRSTRLSPVCHSGWRFNALGALGYVESALEIAQQCEGQLIFRRWWSRRAVPELTPTGCWAGTPDA